MMLSLSAPKGKTSQCESEGGKVAGNDLGLA